MIQNSENVGMFQVFANRVTYVTGFMKTDPSSTFGISRVINLSPVLCCSHVKFTL